MTKTQIIVAAVIAAVSVVVLFVFSSFIVGRAHEWSADHSVLSAPVETVVNASEFIHGYPMYLVFAVFGTSFGLVWLFNRLFGKHETAA
jgi:type II secretory pathway component PulF